MMVPIWILLGVRVVVYLWASFRTVFPVVVQVSAPFRLANVAPELTPIIEFPSVPSVGMYRRISLQQRARPLRTDLLNRCYDAALSVRPLPSLVPPIMLLTRLRPLTIDPMTGVTLLAPPRLTRHALHELATCLTLRWNLLLVLLLWPSIIGTVFLLVKCSATFPLTFPKFLAITTIPLPRRRLTLDFFDWLASA